MLVVRLLDTFMGNVCFLVFRLVPKEVVWMSVLSLVVVVVGAVAAVAAGEHGSVESVHPVAPGLWLVVPRLP